MVRSLRMRWAVDGCKPVFSLISLSETGSSRAASTSSRLNMRSITWTVGVLGRLSDRLVMGSNGVEHILQDEMTFPARFGLTTCFDDQASAALVAADGSVSSDPMSIYEHFVRTEPGLVAHFVALGDPVTQIDMGQVQGSGLLDLPEHAVCAVARLVIGLVERIDRRETVVEHVHDRHHLELRGVSVSGRFVKLDQSRVDAALQEKLGVLVDAVVIHAPACVAAVLVAQVQLVVFRDEAQFEHPGLQVRVAGQAAPLAAAGGKALHRNPQRHTGLTAIAVRAVGEHAAAMAV